MRGLLLFGAFLAIIALAAIYPYAGLLAWAWFSFMHPHRETYGFAYDFQFDMSLALLTMTAWLFSRERKALPVGTTPMLILAFGLWMCVTTYFAVDPDFSYNIWERTEKTLIFVFFAMMMTNTMTRAHALVWVMVIALGYYAVKGAGFVLLSGSGLVFGPEDSMIADNNALSVALVTILPLLLYLFRNSEQQFLRIGCVAVAVAIVVTVVGTFSRGGFLALLAMGALLVLRSRSKFTMLAAGALVAVVLVQVAPDSWRERMDTIFAKNVDESVQGRFNAWSVAWNVASERPITGGGFRFGEQQRVWDRYTGISESTEFHAAHNIYFQVLGEHGFVGLAVYLLIILSALKNTQVASRLARDRTDARPADELANALQLSILCLAIAGNSLSLAYYDLHLTLFGLTFALRRLMENAQAQEAPGSQVVNNRRPRAGVGSPAE
jgi:probable O-glycosylation ligase (exosortase A-associated)